jgi:hypothetical protein
MTVTSGQKLKGSWLPSGPLGDCLKMLLDTSAWASTKCYLTWKDEGYAAWTLLFQLAPSMPRTDVTGSGLWRTPMAADGTHNHCLAPSVIAGKTTLTLTNQVKGAAQGLWPTPTVNGNHNRKGLSKTNGDGLSTAVKMWPTPGAADNRDRGHMGMPAIQRRQAKGKQLNLSMVVSDVSGALNPTWVEWLMGYPEGWTDLNASETQLSLKSPK